MKKTLFFKKSSTECAGFPADRFTGAYKSGDAVLNFYFDDVENRANKTAEVVLVVDIDDDTTMKTYMEALVNEIAYGKSPVITIYDDVNDTGFGGGKELFSAITSIALTNA